MKHIYLAAIIVLLTISNSYSADIASDVRAGSGGFDNSNGGYFEFGIGLNTIANKEGIGLRSAPFIAGAYRYHSFFLEALSPGVSLNGGTVGGITLGLNVWRNKHWAVDLLAASSRWRLSRQTLRFDASTSDNPILEDDLLSRNTFYNGAGIRFTGYLGDAIFQYRLVSDTLHGNGVTSSARFGYSHQLKNWNLHGVIGIEHVSQKTGQYWYGVSEEEASTRFPSYKISASTISYSAEIGATFPVRENVVFRSTARYTQFADDIAKSPIQENEFDLRWNTSLSYVF